ncbi:MAG: hypothetical protein WDO69_12335 [Pseudomonadota bacterium]
MQLALEAAYDAGCATRPTLFPYEAGAGGEAEDGAGARAGAGASSHAGASGGH